LVTTASKLNPKLRNIQRCKKYKKCKEFGKKVVVKSKLEMRQKFKTCLRLKAPTKFG